MNLIDGTDYVPIMSGPKAFTPTTIVGIIISYLVFVYQIGPKLMKNRTAYKLKTFMSFYNIFQVLSCLYVINRVWDLTSWGIFNISKCVHYLPNTPQRQIYDDIAHKLILLKIIELMDTIIFVLRKKQNQITYLHVFHHSSTITLGYLNLKYAGVNGALFAIFLNSYVHVIMYTYYFFANICSAETMQKFRNLKKYITIIQMIQFCLILAQASILWKSCGIPTFIKYYYCTVVTVIFYGFYDFYKKAYLNKESKISK